MHRSRVSGAGAEAAALTILRRAGYAIDAVQPSVQTEVVVDGELQTFLLRADVLVSRRGRTALVEVKAGGSVASVQHAQTRRQLLEYACAFDVDELLLVDGVSGAIQTIEFPFLSR